MTGDITNVSDMAWCAWGERSVRTGCLHAGVSKARTRAGRLASEFPGDRRKLLGTRVSATLRVLGGARASLWVGK